MFEKAQQEHQKVAKKAQEKSDSLPLNDQEKDTVIKTYDEKAGKLLGKINTLLNSSNDDVKELGQTALREFLFALHLQHGEFEIRHPDKKTAKASLIKQAVLFNNNLEDALQKYEDSHKEIINKTEINKKEKYEDKKEEVVKEKEKIKEVVEKMEVKETKASDFNEANLNSPEGIQLEFQKLIFQQEKFGKEMASFQSGIVNFSKSFQKFEAGKKSWGVFLRGSPFVEDLKSVEIKNSLDIIKNMMIAREAGLKARREKLENYAQKIKAASKKQVEQTLLDQERDIKQAEEGEEKTESNIKEQKGQYELYQEHIDALTEQKNSLKEYRDGISRGIEQADQAKEKRMVKKEDLHKFSKILENSISNINKALNQKYISSKKKEELIKKRDELLSHGNNTKIGIKQIETEDNVASSVKEELIQKNISTEHSSVSIDKYLSESLDPALTSISSSIALLEDQKKNFTPMKEQIRAKHLDRQNQLTSFHDVVSRNVDYFQKFNEQNFEAFTRNKEYIKGVKISKPNLWDATGGLLLSKISEGLGKISRVTDIVSEELDIMTKDYPILNNITNGITTVFLDIPSGVIEGASELVEGIGTMISSPLATLNGMGALIGRDPQTGEWSFGTAGHSWKEMGKALIAYEDFSKGKVGKGVGKVALNVLLTATGAGAAAKGVQATSIAFKIARVSGSNVLKSSLKASWMGTKVFATEIGSTLKSLPRGVAKFSKVAIATPNRMAKFFTKKVKGLRKGKAFKLEQAAAKMSNELKIASSKLDEITIGGKKASEIQVLSGKSFKDIQKLSPAELAKIGIADVKSMKAFLKYKQSLKTIEGLKNVSSQLGQKAEAMSKKALEAKKPENIMARIKSGELKGFKNYEGIRDLGKKLNLSMEEQFQLTKKFMESSGKSIDDLIKIESTIGKLKKIKIPGTVDDIINGAKGVETIINKIDDVKSLGQMDELIKGIANPAEQKLLRGLLDDLRSKGMKASSLDELEKTIIFKESLQYLRDYKAALKAEGAGGLGVKIKNSQDIFDLIRGNQRKLAHQTAIDHKFFTGSDHGITHILEGNMKMAEKIFKDMGAKISPRDKVLIRQAILDHDMGYTINALEQAKGGKYFAMTKDHPLYSTLWVEGKKAEYIKYFGESGYEIIRNSILDHSNAAKLDLTAKGGRLVENIVAGVDCLGVTADVKMMKLFKDPEMMSKLAKLGEFSDRLAKISKRVGKSPTKKQAAAIAKLNKEISQVYNGMASYVKKNNKFSKSLKKSYLRALKKNFNRMDTGFAIKRDFGSHGAVFDGIQVAKDGSVTVNMGITKNLKIVREMFKKGDDVSTSALAKAMDDYGLKLKKGEGTMAEVTRNGVKSTVKYSLEEFAADLALLEDGKLASLSVKTPRATFRFTKNAEKGAALAQVLTRDRLLKTAIEQIRGANLSRIGARRVMNKLTNSTDLSTLSVKGKTAEVIIKKINRFILNDNRQEAVKLLKKLYSKGMGG